MRSPTNVKEVQYLTGRLAALYCFVSCVRDQDFLFFSTIKKKEKFKWTSKCDEAFQRVKYFLMSPLILTRLREGSPLHLYLSITNLAISSLLVQETDKAERSTSFLSKVFRGNEAWYKNIEKLALAIIVMERNLFSYFQGQNIFIKTNYPIQQVLKNPNMAGRIVYWTVELSEYDI